MVHSPSKVWKDGVLVDRNLASVEPGGGVEDPEFVSGSKPYKAPMPTKYGTVEDKNAKRVDSAENKAVSKASKKTASK